MENRELKFRVWDLYEKSWMTNWEKQFAPIWGKDGNFKDNLTTYIWKVRSSGFIVQQFIGLKDKNGREIYEGDIVKVKCYEDFFDLEGFYVTYQVKWCDTHVGFRGFNNKMIENNYSGTGLPGPIEIIGNIFENPELIK